MVRIVIVGEGGVAGLIEYPDDSKTEAVEKKLLNGYGMGILMRKGVGVLCETLAAGDYEYYATTPGSQRGDNSPQKRRPNSTTIDQSTVVATLRFKVLDEDSWRSTMYAGKAMIVGFSEEKSVWVTTRHGGMIRGTKVFIQIGKLTVAGDCIYDDEKSDLALVAGTTVESIGAERPMVSNEITIGRLVGTFGYPSYLDPQLGSGLTWAYIASTSAGPKNGLPAESSGWKTHRFFLLDKSMDACMSGGPVVNTNGFVVGMLVASRCVNNGQTSWVLSASYISDALDNVVVEWIPPPVRDITKSLLPKAELKG